MCDQVCCGKSFGEFTVLYYHNASEDCDIRVHMNDMIHSQPNEAASFYYRRKTFEVRYYDVGISN